MRGLAGAAIVGAGLAACTLTTDLDGFAGGPTPDGAAPPAVLPDSGVPKDGGPIAETGALTEAGPTIACSIPTDSDPMNCGACGRSCLGGECKGGKCSAARLIDGVFQHPLGIGVSRGKLYVGDDNTLVQADLDGTNLKVVVSSIDASYVFGNDDAVFFSEDNSKKVKRWAHPEDGTTTDVTGVIDAVSGVAVFGSGLYYTRYTDEGSGGGIYRVPLAGGASTKLKAWNHAETVTVADGKVYFAGDGQDVAELLHDDGTTDEIFSGGGTTGIAIRGDDAFVTLQGAGQVFHVSLSTKAKEMVASGLKGPSAIVATPNAIYWAEVNNGSVGVLVR